MISVLILTKNEEQDLPGCLKSVEWCDDVHIFDSFSDDRTVEIARNAGAKVTQRKFDGYSSQRNAALETVSYKHPWLLILDADERIPDRLAAQLKQHVSQAHESVNGFRFRRNDYLGKSWLKYSQISPLYIRLIRIGKARYHREINEVLEVDGRVEEIDGYFEHYPFSKGLSHWIGKHNQYSSMEAVRWVEEHKGNMKFSIQKALFSKDFSEKRYHQKGLFYKLPFRPAIKWLYILFWRKGLLDGKAGFTYASLQAIYEYFIVLKTEEILTNDLN
jgi:glycosyltransferase involved in cell wall biosynthesis